MRSFEATPTRSAPERAWLTESPTCLEIDFALFDSARAWITDVHPTFVEENRGVDAWHVEPGGFGPRAARVSCAHDERSAVRGVRRNPRRQLFEKLRVQTGHGR